jgi:hypothetical protein
MPSQLTRLLPNHQLFALDTAMGFVSNLSLGSFLFGVVRDLSQVPISSDWDSLLGYHLVPP